MRANRLSQTTARISGATISWGKRAAASLVNSPCCGGALGNPAHHGDAARDDLAMIELGNPGEARALGDDQSQQELAVGAEHLLLEQREEGFENGMRRARRARSPPGSRLR